MDLEQGFFIRSVLWGDCPCEHVFIRYVSGILQFARFVGNVHEVFVFAVGSFFGDFDWNPFLHGVVYEICSALEFGEKFGVFPG